MSTRRVPLSSNQNVVNSPLRSAALKQKRTLTQLQREEPYDHQPPPAKKQILDAHTQRVARSPSQQFRVTKSQIPVQQRRPTSTYESKLSRERAPPAKTHHEEPASNDISPTDIERIQTWTSHHRARFPKQVFYFDQIPNDVAHGLKKQISALGGREAAFFSIEVTHVITSRQVPAEAGTRDDGRDIPTAKGSSQAMNAEPEPTATINPSLLTRFSENPIKRKLFDADLRLRAQRIPQPQDQGLRAPAPKKSVDILTRAKEMGKKIWPVDKMVRMATILLETDIIRCAEMAYGRSSKSTKAESRAPEDRNLLRLLQKERVNGPSDRDPTVQAREIVHFKGPHIYIWDIEEKQKPIMVKEYEKVSDKTKGKWPQFQSAAQGRCPFVEDSEAKEAREAKEAKQARQAERETRAKEKEKERARAESVESQSENKPVLHPPKMAPPKPIISKRTLGEMQLNHSRQSSVTSLDFPTLSRNSGGDSSFSRKAFTSHAANGRVLAGEPVASGVQPSNITSAIRSQMVSSTAATPGVITGPSKEVVDLQRQVLKRQASHDVSSRPSIETSFREKNPIQRPSTLGRTSSRPLDRIGEIAPENIPAEKELAVRDATSKKPAKPQENRELKPGYCENCGEKYADFEEHIVTKMHRRFAEDSRNWTELDSLLSQLERTPKPRSWKDPRSWSRSPELDGY